MSNNVGANASGCWYPTEINYGMLNPGWVLQPGGTQTRGPELQAQIDKENKLMETKKLLGEAQIQQAQLVKLISDAETELSQNQEELKKVTQLILSLQTYNG